MIWSADRCTSGWAFQMCRETHVHFFFCALPSLRSARRPTARWTQTSQQFHVKETPCPEGQVTNTLSTAASQSFNGQQRQKQTKLTSYAATQPEEPWIHGRAATTVQCMSRWEGDGPRGAHGGVGVEGHSRAESVAWNVRLASRSAHGGDASTERVGRRGKGEESQWDETEWWRRGEGGKAAACCKKVGGSIWWAKTTWVTTVGGAWVAASARWKAASHGDREIA